MASTPPHGWEANNMMNHRTSSFSDMQDPRQQQQYHAPQYQAPPTIPRVTNLPTRLHGHAFACGWRAFLSSTNQRYYFVPTKTANPTGTYAMPDEVTSEMTGSHWIEYLRFHKEFPALAVQNPQAGDFQHFNWDKLGKILMRLRADPDLQEIWTEILVLIPSF